jgi:hypothetical protein
MREFVELQGASGASYRFRHWRAGDDHLPIAGNYVVVRDTDDGLTILAVEITDDLSGLRQSLKPAIRDHAGHQIYTRLNVSRAARTAEHEDIVAANKPRRTT